jgi:ribosome-associated toxin RatA of RatAB toxin-antitoxin module
MADQTTSSIRIDASPADVMAVIADFRSYPEWTGAVKQVEILSEYPDGRAQEVYFVLDAGAIKDEYTLAYEWAGDSQVRWSLVKARMLTSMEGSYTLADTGDGSTHVTYQLAVDVKIPMIGMIKRKAEKVITDTALKELKKRVAG